uniref:CTCHY-type domain-containing protein n=2 Tax=Lutzomyia longipalpis TaxID=7200 RepID=A0A1B0EY23_LUTLO
MFSWFFNNFLCKMGGRVEIVPKNEENIPAPFCLHGPCICFRKVGRNSEHLEYYACSLYRDGKNCRAFIIVKDWMNYQDREEKNKWVIREILRQNESQKLKMKDFSKKPRKDFCKTCGAFVNEEQLHQHSKHLVLRDLGKQQIREIQECPSKFLELKENDKGEAQYIFSGKTLNFFENLLVKLNFTKILCIGTPTLHAQLSRKSSRQGIRSYLLDIDERYGNFFGRKEFSRFNMFNCYFFESQASKKNLMDFLKQEKGDKLAIFVDPPFGCRTELLGEGLRNVQKLWRECNGNPTEVVTIFLIFPYYMETYVKKEMPQLEMMDYRVNYVNHTTFHDDEDGGRFGSPVRVFTNAQPSLIVLPEDEGYRECKICRRWVARENSHCSICQQCPSKNGGSYKHCNMCGLCVKSYYKHCNICNRCTQESGHNCKDYQKFVSCWICRRTGHIEKFCSLRSRKGKITAKRICGICLKKNHSELICTRDNQS